MKIPQTDSHSTAESGDDDNWNAETRVQNTIFKTIQRPIARFKHMEKSIKTWERNLWNQFKTQTKSYQKWMKESVKVKIQQETDDTEKQANISSGNERTNQLNK